MHDAGTPGCRASGCPPAPRRVWRANPRTPPPTGSSTTSKSGSESSSAGRPPSTIGWSNGPPMAIYWMSTVLSAVALAAYVIAWRSDNRTPRPTVRPGRGHPDLGACLLHRRAGRGHDSRRRRRGVYAGVHHADPVAREARLRSRYANAAGSWGPRPRFGRRRGTARVIRTRLTRADRRGQGLRVMDSELVSDRRCGLVTPSESVSDRLVLEGADARTATGSAVPVERQDASVTGEALIELNQRLAPQRSRHPGWAVSRSRRHYPCDTVTGFLAVLVPHQVAARLAGEVLAGESQFTMGATTA